MEEEYKKLLKLVRRMRSLQARYFKSRSHFDLKAALSLEKEVDNYLKQHLDEEPPKLFT